MSFSNSDYVFQLNFTSGIGDFFCALYLIHCLAHLLQKRSSLIQNFSRNAYFHDTPQINLDSFFQIEYNLFRSVQKYPVVKTIPNYRYLQTPFLYHKHEAGQHWFDVFQNEKNTDYAVEMIQKVIEKFQNNQIVVPLDLYIPKFLHLAKKFEIGVHIRNFDASETIDHCVKLDNLVQAHAHASVCVVTNSTAVRQQVSQKYPKIFMMCQREPEVSYHYGSFKNNCKDNEKLLVSLYDTLIEMDLLSHCQKIFVITEWNRLSNFLWYARLHSQPCITIL